MFPESALDAAPHAPGVYLMLDEKSSVLYVGKAKDLVKRLSSYSRFTGKEYNKTSVLLEKVTKVDTIITSTEKEALLLEASLIKKHKPKYNIILRDDKNYPFIKVTVQEEWPRVFMVRRKKKDKARYFGPYSSSSSMWATLRLISSLFPLRKCKGSRLKPRVRPCLNHQIGKCLAPCCGYCDPQQYNEHVRKIIMLLEGKNRDLVRTLKDQMLAASATLDFEKAALLRDQIAALTRTLEKQVISASHSKDQDVIGYARNNTAVAVSILFIRNGLITGNRSFFLTDPFGDDFSILSQVLSQFYSENSVFPKEILLPFAPSDFDLHRERFIESGEIRTYLKIPQRGDSFQLISMANTNAAQVFEDKDKKKRSWKNLAGAMVRLLHLDRDPDRIECLDISNISGSQAVGSLVCFHKGESDKINFRHFTIKTVEGPNDYAMMEEVIHRRLSRSIADNNLPDLFIVDGGKGQLGMAIKVAKELGVKDEIDWIGIAKERNSEGEKIFKPGRKNPIILAPHNPVLLYLMRIRDESHRFGITFHRKLRKKATLFSELDTILGIGPNKKNQLLKTLGSLKRIKAASVDELQKVPGIGRELASQIHQHFRATLE